MNVIREFTQLSSLSKFAIGGAFGAAAIYAAASTNPVTIVGLAVLGQAAAWLPDGIRRCFQRPPAVAPALLQQQQQNIGHEVHHPEGLILPMQENDADLQQAIRASLQPRQEDEDTQRAIQMSLLEQRRRGWGDDDSKGDRKDDGLEQAIRASLQPRQEDVEIESAIQKSIAEQRYDFDADWKSAVANSKNPLEQVYSCPFEKALNGDSRVDEDVIIPQGLLLELESGENCNVVNYMIAFLTQGESPNAVHSRDMFGKPVSIVDIQAASLCLGINYDQFLNIWPTVEGPEYLGGIHHIDPNVQVRLRTDQRILLFRQMLKESDAGSARAAIAYCQKYHPEIWK